jgi:predicted phage-related endonuclease
MPRKPAITPESVPLDHLAAEFVQLRKLQREIAKREAAEKLIISAIKTAMGDSARGTLAGQDAVLWGRSVREQVDVKTIRDKYPDIAAACVKLVEVRSFKVLDDVASVGRR